MNPSPTQATNPPGKAGTPGKPRIALIGCGRIAEVYHLPALTKHRSLLGELVLVDPDRERLQLLASQFGIQATAQDYRDILREVDGAIIAIPNKLHFPVGMELLAHGVHVLCEKPLAETAREALQMVEQAREHDATLSVNHTRRLFPTYGKIRELLAEGVLGPISSIEYSDGQLFGWASASGFYFREPSTTGVLMDKGIHGLDTICWWLDDKPELLSAQSDSFGGREGVMEVKLRYRGGTIVLRCSSLNRLPNQYAIVGELGSIRGGIEEWDRVTIERRSGKTERVPLPGRERSYNDFAVEMIRNFIDVTSGRAEPLVPGSDVIASLELIEACYRNAVRFPMPWYEQLEARHAR